MEIVLTAPNVLATLALGITATFAGSVLVAYYQKKENSRWHVYRDLIPAAGQALDNPDAVVDSTNMSLTIEQLKTESFVLGRKERRSVARIDHLEGQRWALIGFGPGMGDKAMPEFHLKNAIRTELEGLSRLIERRLRWKVRARRNS